ncbi:hypothetical protein Vqi01_19620 [Micromonospora qiuiae]|uniref:Uncharacterized protein n=1 Tax=Micromonospora qiuiae TaxID=502268 RepID=A0ABQ4J9F9_9ACTN|nr:hypothetical protein [Micromonospora qiuiae]GIJ26800.1 hypothetical protein Vqi01_19620 [Micromonospora qiuiae]
MAIGSWFATEFDDPVPARDLPAVFTSGGDPEVLVADRFSRGVAIVGRVQAASGAVVLKVRTDGRAVRVRVNLHVDSATQAAWSGAGAPARGVRELPRLIMVRAQATARAAVLISRHRGRVRMVEAHGWVEFDLGADEVGADGLLVIELADAALPPWSASSLSPLSAVGVRINQVELAPAEDADQPTGSRRLTGASAQLAGVVSAGGLVGARGLGEGQPRSRFVVVNADSAEVRCRLRITAASTPPAAFRHPSHAWLRRRRGQTVLKALRVARRGAGYALFAASPFTRTPRPDQLVVRAASLVDGADCRVGATAAADDLLDVLIERTSPGPVLIGLAEPDPTRRRVSDLACQVVEVQW